MPESAQHARLVEAIVAHTENRLGPFTEILVREDAVRPRRGERPPRVFRFTPDVYATDVPTTMTLIGEAKTAADLDTKHSRVQIAAFLEYLAYTPGGLFVLAVPILAKPRARWILRELGDPLGADAPQAEVIDDSAIRME